MCFIERGRPIGYVRIKDRLAKSKAGGLDRFAYPVPSSKLADGLMRMARTHLDKRSRLLTGHLKKRNITYVKAFQESSD
jgi:hypothetical protein